MIVMILMVMVIVMVIVMMTPSKGHVDHNATRIAQFGFSGMHPVGHCCTPHCPNVESG